jgi:hypothetical protein
MEGASSFRGGAGGPRDRSARGGAGPAWLLEGIEEAQAAGELAAWIEEDGALVPRNLDRFLAALDLRLRQLAGDRYRPDRGFCGDADGEVPCHGFAYELRNGTRVSRRFVGFAREGGAVDLRVAAPDQPAAPALRFCVYPLEATPIARVLAGLD